MRPGRREGVEGEIRRDLTTLARNNAISDAVLVSAEEDLSQVVADVQDLGIRVLIVHITVGGNWTISRSLRQECDDIIEIGEGHLRPYTELVSGTDALRGDDPYQLALPAGRALTNGHGSAIGPLGSHQALAAGCHPAPPGHLHCPGRSGIPARRAAGPGAAHAVRAAPAPAHRPGRAPAGRPGRAAGPTGPGRAARPGPAEPARQPARPGSAGRAVPAADGRAAGDASAAGHAQPAWRVQPAGNARAAEHAGALDHARAAEPAGSAHGPRPAGRGRAAEHAG